MAYQRMFRAIVASGASLVTGGALSAICDGCGSGETACGVTTVVSPCGFDSFSTTCTFFSCNDLLPHAGAPADCTVGANPTRCTVSVVVGDGTQRTISVPAGCGGPFVDFTSATCVAPPADAGADAPSEDATGEAAIDADAGSD